MYSVVTNFRKKARSEIISFSYSLYLETFFWRLHWNFAKIFGVGKISHLKCYLLCDQLGGFYRRYALLARY